ncbi:MAG TPA: hypothetical protein VFZ61_13670, partial [Polyangiales bacterium]
MSELSQLPPGTRVLVGERLVAMPALKPGDRVIPVGRAGELVVVSAAAHAEAALAVSEAHAAVAALARVSPDSISAFFRGFAQRLGQDEIWAEIERA